MGTEGKEIVLVPTGRRVGIKGIIPGRGQMVGMSGCIPRVGPEGKEMWVPTGRRVGIKGLSLPSVGGDHDGPCSGCTLLGWDTHI